MEQKNLIGFDNEKYLREQTTAILERVNRFNHTLYLESGCKDGTGKPEKPEELRSTPYTYSDTGR